MKIDAGVQTSHLRQRFPLLYFCTRPLDLLQREAFESLMVFKDVLSRSVESADSKDQAMKTIDGIENLFRKSRPQVPLVEQIESYGIIDAHPDLSLAWETWCSLEEIYDLPRSLTLDYIDGLKWDVENREMQTLEDFLRYAYLTGGVFGFVAARILNLDPFVYQTAVDAASSARISSMKKNLERDLCLGRKRRPKDIFPLEVSKSETARFLDVTSETLFQSIFDSISEPRLRALVPLRLRFLALSCLVLHRESEKKWLGKIDLWFDAIVRWLANSVRRRSNSQSFETAPSSLSNPIRHQKFVLSKSFGLTNKRSSDRTQDRPNMSH